MAVIKFPGSASRRGSGRDNAGSYGDDRIEEGYDSDIDDDGYIDDGHEDERDIEGAREAKRLHEEAAAESARPRRQKTRGQKVRFAMILALIFCGIGAFCLFLLNQNENAEYSQMELASVASISIPETVSFADLDDKGHVLLYNKDGASLIDSKGSSLWNIPFEMQQPLVSVQDGIAAIADYDGSTIYICDVSGQIGQVATSLPILQITAASNGNVAAVLEDSGTIWIYLYDEQGNTIAYIRRTMNQSGYPTGIALSPDGRLFSCAQLTTDGADIQTSIVFYNFGSVGQSAVDNAVGGYNYASEVFPYLAFLNDSTMIAVSDSRVSFFSGEDVPQSIADAFHPAELQDVRTGDGYCALVFPDTTGEELSELDVYNAQGKCTGTIKFSLEYTGIKISGGLVIIYNSENILVYNVNGEERYSGSFGVTVNDVVPTGHANKYELITDSDVETMTLR